MRPPKAGGPVTVGQDVVYVPDVEQRPPVLYTAEGKPIYRVPGFVIPKHGKA